MVKESVKKLVDEKINGKRVVVFSKTTCGFCSMAKDALKNYLKELESDEYEIMEINRHEDCNEIQTYLQQKTGARSVPRVFIDQQFIGGGDETVAKHKNGQLAKLLAKK